MLQRESQVTVDAPSNIEAVVTDDRAARKLRIHFLAYNPTPRSTASKNRPYILPGLIEDVPMFRVKVATAIKVIDAKALNPNTRVRITDQHIEATIEDIHDVLVINY